MAVLSVLYWTIMRNREQITLKVKPGIVAHAYNLSDSGSGRRKENQKFETKPGQLSETLSPNTILKKTGDIAQW